MEDKMPEDRERGNQVEFWLAVVIVGLGLVLEGTGMYALTLENKADQYIGIVGFLGGCMAILGGAVILGHMLAKEMIENVNARPLKALPSVIFSAPFKRVDPGNLN